MRAAPAAGALLVCIVAVVSAEDSGLHLASSDSKVVFGPNSECAIQLKHDGGSTYLESSCPIETPVAETSEVDGGVLFASPDDYVMFPAEGFMLDFELEFTPRPGTVKLTITAKGYGTPDPNAPHVITFGTDVITYAGTISGELVDLAGTWGIASITSNGGSASNLVSGASYDLTIRYQAQTGTYYSASKVDLMYS